jgi:hypothetical protein
MKTTHTACLHLHGARPYFLIRPRQLGTPGVKIPFDQRQEEEALRRLWADPAALGVCVCVLVCWGRGLWMHGHLCCILIWEYGSNHTLSIRHTAAELAAFEGELEEAMSFQLYHRVWPDRMSIL